MNEQQTPQAEEKPTAQTSYMPPHWPRQESKTQPSQPDPDYVAMDDTEFSHILNHLLKKPLSVIHEINSGKSNPLTALLIISLSSLAVFGLVLGMFSSGEQLWAAPVKVVGGIFFSGLICLPSLYIFSALGGVDARVKTTLGLMLTFLAITSLLLVGFAPVAWLFSTSSSSLVFFGFLSLSIWIVCLIFGLRVITRASRSLGGGKGGHLYIWAIIFILVTLQMTTTLRPIIGSSDDFLNLKEKRFFLGYWSEAMNGESHSESKQKNNNRSSSNDKPEQTEHTAGTEKKNLNH